MKGGNQRRIKNLIIISVSNYWRFTNPRFFVFCFVHFMLFTISRSISTHSESDFMLKKIHFASHFRSSHGKLTKRFFLDLRWKFSYVMYAEKPFREQESIISCYQSNIQLIFILNPFGKESCYPQ